MPEPSASKRCSRRRTLALDGGGSSSSLAMIAATSHVSSSPSLDASYSDRNKSTMRKSSRCMCASSDRSTVLTIASTSASVGGAFLPLPPAALGGELDRCRVRGGMVRAAVDDGVSVMLHVVGRRFVSATVWLERGQGGLFFQNLWGVAGREPAWTRVSVPSTNVD